MTTRIIYLTPDRKAPDPASAAWTASWGEVSEPGRSIGEAIERILRRGHGGPVDRIMLIVRERDPMRLETKSP